MDLQETLTRLQAQNAFGGIALNPITQFGANGQPYRGAEILPERIVRRNEYTEAGVRYRTVIANDGGRYSPAQKKSGGLYTGSFKVSLGDSDIASDFTGDDYDAVLEMLDLAGTTNTVPQAVAAAVVGWSQSALNLALIEHNEKQRWQAVVDAQVIRKSDNGGSETINYPNPDGHRVAAGGDWSDPSYNILGDLLARKRFMAKKGFTLNRSYCSTEVLGVMLQNESLAKAAGKSVITVQANGTLQQSASAFTEADLNGLMSANGLPSITTYDRTYFLDDGTTERFLKRDVFVMVCTTGRTENVSLIYAPDTALPFRPINNTLGYLAVGRPVGQRTQGRVLRIEAKDNKPPRLEGEGWQTSLPVLTEADALTVITGITLPA